MRLSKILLVVTAALTALIGLGLLAAGGTLVAAHATQRDAVGFYTTPTVRLQTPTYAITSQVDFGARPTGQGWVPTHPVGTVRIRAVAAGADSLFMGIASTADVDAWLTRVAHEHVTSVSFGPVSTHTQQVDGIRQPALPATQSFWVVSTSGVGARTLVWPSERGRWTVVLMHPNASLAVAAEVNVGAKTGVLLPIGIGVGLFGLLLLGVAGVLAVLGLRRKPAPGPQPEVTRSLDSPLVSLAPGAYPVRLDGHLDPSLSRWLWLVKPLLVIPHVVVLAFLWLAVSALTVIAGVAILVSGRYPRRIFDFNAGVMRWTWRVSFYALSAFGTDRYPPFSLRTDPSYPAELTIDFPDHLSRGLVLVKWWLLALPHYVIVAVFAGGWGVSRSGGWRAVGESGGGLIAIMATVAVVVLAVRGSYPVSIFDFVMGMNRWCYRVLAYAALMRDEYPPFRFDSGGTDPGHLAGGAPPPSPDRTGDLVGTGG